MTADERALKPIHDAKHRLSESVGHDPYRLVEHLQKLQERHKNRVITKEPSGPRVRDAGT